MSWFSFSWFGEFWLQIGPLDVRREVNVSDAHLLQVLAQTHVLRGADVDDLNCALETVYELRRLITYLVSDAPVLSCLAHVQFVHRHLPVGHVAHFALLGGCFFRSEKGTHHRTPVRGKVVLALKIL